MSDPRSQEVTQILHELVGLPGSEAVSVLARRFARYGPAESGMGYQEDVHSFEKDELPEELNLPLDSDEIVITCRGALPQPELATELMDEIERIRQSPCWSTGWDVRAHIPRRAEPARDYRLTIFTSRSVSHYVS